MASIVDIEKRVNMVIAETFQDLIKEKAAIYYSEVVGWRRHLHQHPELSYDEEKTSAFVRQCLDDMGVEYTSGIGGHGVVGLIRGGKSNGDLVALRADMDALPIQEENNTDYRSKVDGVMHACGHDVHTSNLLGTTRILQDIRAELDRDIRLIFQPAEEKLPGGASLMIKDGVMENPRPRCIVGFHVFPQMQAGQVGMRPGIYMASADELYVTVKGKGGHAAIPQGSIDPIVIAAQLIGSLQTIVSRGSDPTIPSVLTFGKIQSKGGATNIIPDEVYLEGTFRTLDESWRAKAHEIMLRQAEHITAAHGATCDFRIDRGYPVLVNDQELTAKSFALSEEILGAERVHELPIRMTAEDFAYYSNEIPACFIRIGSSNDELGIGAPLHTPTFDVDESSFLTSMSLMAYLASKI